MNKPSLARAHPSQEINWQQQYKDSITTIDELCDALDLHIEQLPISYKADKQFPLRVPWNYVQRMRKSDPQDPLLLQVLPHADEENKAVGFSKDPVADLKSIKSTGLLQKYHGRALLLATSRCAIHCRYCFRRHFPYASQNPRHDTWHNAINKIAKDPSINEIILSGGDPLVLSDIELKKLISQLESITHIKRLRIHTRLPVVLPSRINNELISWINRTRLKVVMVLHINHAQELDNQFQKRLQGLAATDCVLLNQSVLLRNINNEADILIQLSEALFQSNILPYYLHLLDKVQGAAHFEVSETQARKIMQEVASKLPGYLVPRLVKEESGHASKTLITF